MTIPVSAGDFHSIDANKQPTPTTTMALSVYNTLTRRSELFEPIDPSLIRMYRCGPTVYKHMHIGHAKTYVSFDVVRRYLMYLYGHDHVLYVMNITDVGHLANDSDDGEDKMEAQARRENRSPFEIALYYEESWFQDLDRINVLRPDRIPHATDFIRQQIEMTDLLIGKGIAYEVNGSVYFDVEEYQRRELPDGFVPYGGLSNRRTEDQQHGGRVEVKSEKRGPHDFALWKKAEPEHSMQWYSPWGWGYPGWHIECSVMSQFYLGETFDIHVGGLDNMFPHHECEIAQSQAANGKPFVRYWMHNNFVNVSGQKMGGELGNATNMKTLFEQFDPMAIRFAILQSHYRSPLEFDPAALQSAQVGLDKVRGTLQRLHEALRTSGVMAESDPSMPTLPFLAKFIEAMDDDFNTPVALAALFEGIGELNRMLASAQFDEFALFDYQRAFAIAFDEILGLNVMNPIGGESSGSATLSGELIALLIALRNEARARKDFATSDAIRDRLRDLGVLLEDGKAGTRWVVA